MFWVGFVNAKNWTFCQPYMLCCIKFLAIDSKSQFLMHKSTCTPNFRKIQNSYLVCKVPFDEFCCWRQCFLFCAKGQQCTINCVTNSTGLVFSERSQVYLLNFVTRSTNHKTYIYKNFIAVEGVHLYGGEDSPDVNPYRTLTPNSLISSCDSLPHFLVRCLLGQSKAPPQSRSRRSCPLQTDLLS